MHVLHLTFIQPRMPAFSQPPHSNLMLLYFIAFGCPFSIIEEVQELGDQIVIHFLLQGNSLVAVSTGFSCVLIYPIWHLSAATQTIAL